MGNQLYEATKPGEVVRKIEENETWELLPCSTVVAMRDKSLSVDMYTIGHQGLFYKEPLIEGSQLVHMGSLERAEDVCLFRLIKLEGEVGEGSAVLHLGDPELLHPNGVDRCFICHRGFKSGATKHDAGKVDDKQISYCDGCLAVLADVATKTGGHFFGKETKNGPQ